MYLLGFVFYKLFIKHFIALTLACLKGDWRRSLILAKRPQETQHDLQGFCENIKDEPTEKEYIVEFFKRVVGAFMLYVIPQIWDSFITQCSACAKFARKKMPKHNMPFFGHRSGRLFL